MNLSNVLNLKCLINGVYLTVSNIEKVCRFDISKTLKLTAQGLKSK